MSGLDEKGLEWPERLTLRDTKVIADEGQRIFTTATGYGYEKREYVRADLAAATPADVGELVERLRERAETLNTGAFVSPDDMSTMGYYSRGSAELDVKVATALERVTRERDEARATLDEVCLSSRQEWQRATSAEAKLAEARKVIERYWKGAYWAAMTDQDADVVNAFLEETK